jgi:hypothetical protein
METDPRDAPPPFLAFNTDIVGSISAGASAATCPAGSRTRLVFLASPARHLNQIYAVFIDGQCNGDAAL